MEMVCVQVVKQAQLPLTEFAHIKWKIVMEIKLDALLISVYLKIMLVVLQEIVRLTVLGINISVV